MKKVVLILLALLVLGLTQAAMAQITTNPATNTATITATKGESLSISAVNVPAFTINPSTGVSTASQNLAITTLWNLAPSRTKVDVCATSTDLVPADNTKNPDTILASTIQASTNGTSWATINNVAGCNQAAVTVVHSYSLTAQADRKSQTKSDTLQLKLTGVPVDLQADTYSGTITVFAYVTP